MSFAQSNGHSQVMSMYGPRSGLELVGIVRCAEISSGRMTECGL